MVKILSPWLSGVVFRSLALRTKTPSLFVAGRYVSENNILLESFSGSFVDKSCDYNITMLHASCTIIISRF